jgi:hypothetical protein
VDASALEELRRERRLMDAKQRRQSLKMVCCVSSCMDGTRMLRLSRAMRSARSSACAKEPRLLLLAWLNGAFY